MATSKATIKKMLKNQEYWKDRNEQLLAYVDEMDGAIIHHVRQGYDQMYREIEQELFAFYGQYAIDNQITRKEAEKQLKGQDLRDYHTKVAEYREKISQLDDADPRKKEWLRAINQQYTASKAHRLDSLLIDIRYESSGLADGIDRSLESHYHNVGEYIYENAFGGIKASSTLNRPAMRQLMNHPFDGKNFSTYIWGNTDKLNDTLRKTFLQGFARGLSPRQLGQEVRKDFNVARANAEAIVRTEGNHIINNATLQRYADADLTFARIHVHLDSRTSDICKHHDKEDKLYTIGEETDNILPAHVHCRSTWIPDREELLEEHWVDEIEYGTMEEEFGTIQPPKPLDGYISENHRQSKEYFNQFDAYHEWAAGLIEDGLSAIQRYTGKDYRTWNQYLRTEGEMLGRGMAVKDADPYRVEIVQKAIADLKKLLTDYEVPENVIVHRQVEAAALPKGYIESLLATADGGRVVLDQGFMSTSAKAYTGNDFGEITYVIEIPKGSKVGAYIAERSRYKTEDEFLLHPNVEFEMVKKIQVDGRQHFEFRALHIKGEEG